MSAQELMRESADKRNEVAKLRLNIRAGSEKDTAKLRKERKYLARIHTVMHAVGGGAQVLKDKPQTSKLPASAKATAGRPAHKRSAKKSSSSKK